MSKTSKFGYLNIANASVIYNNQNKNEFALQNYIRYSINRNIGLIGGGYLNKGGYFSSVGVQFLKADSVNFFMTIIKIDRYGIISPQESNWNYTNLAGLVLYEYKPKINSSLRLYSRIQVSSSWNIHQHNRTSAQLRLGLDFKNIIVGIAAGFDRYIQNYENFYNIGLFVRKEL